MVNFDKYWNYLVETGIATDEELKLITCINGYNEEALNDVLYVRTGYRDLEQIAGEDENAREYLEIIK